ncbi:MULTISPECIES: hypothetical protein [unclassified Kitasatospora]|uniref:hypothetical protein n=1 Tax=unclassified Kitasatospora TaxID=2633591 RepID=UPI002476785D|nr:hypothetical protein [Kitasatospora sp. MAA19]MDH6705882.1 hypothetical protein [Kitasatospora sp. MAA19]
MGSILNRATADQRRDAADVVDDLTTVLALGGVKLPSVEVDWEHGRMTGCYLISLGSARPSELLRVVDLLRKGLRYERLTYDD